MDLTFLNGSDQQKEVVRSAVTSLLHLDLSHFDFAVEVSFVPDPLQELHNEFATTTDGDPVDMRIREDFPAFAGAEWRSTQFALETVAHEIGHAITDKLPLVDQESLATLFGTTVAAWRVGDDWKDIPYEGIAETFKDAFLPGDMRAYSNRTNHSIPINKYAEFRSIYRNAEADGTNGGIDIPEYNLDLFRQGDISTVEDDMWPNLPWAGTVTNPLSLISSGDGLRSYGDLLTVYSAGSDDQAYIDFVASLATTLLLPDWASFDIAFSPALDSFGWVSLLGGGWNAVHIDEIPDPTPRYEFNCRVSYGDEVVDRGFWYEERTVYPNIWPDTSGFYTVLVGPDLGAGVPQPGDSLIRTLPVVPFDRDGDVVSCGTPLHDARIQAVLTMDIEIDNADVLAADLIPEMQFVQAAYNACPSGVTPQTVPDGSIGFVGSESRQRIVRHPVHG